MGRGALVFSCCFLLLLVSEVGRLLGTKLKNRHSLKLDEIYWILQLWHPNRPIFGSTLLLRNSFGSDPAIIKSLRLLRSGLLLDQMIRCRCECLGRTPHQEILWLLAKLPNQHVVMVYSTGIQEIQQLHLPIIWVLYQISDGVSALPATWWARTFQSCHPGWGWCHMQIFTWKYLNMGAPCTCWNVLEPDLMPGLHNLNFPSKQDVKLLSKPNLSNLE